MNKNYITLPDLKKYNKVFMKYEHPSQSVSTSINNYTSPEKVVDIVLDLRDEINKELTREEEEEESWIQKCRAGYSALVLELKEGKKKIDEEKAKQAALRAEYNKKKKLLDEVKAEHAAQVENKSIKPVTPVEMHEYNTVNASCSKRLTPEEKVVSSSDEEEIKEGKKRVIGKQGDRSKANEEESDEEEWTLSSSLRWMCGDRAVGRSARYGEIIGA
ncbi:hypothetical protein C1646_799883 [Rhizophagus diaphanus]|nr:hypothetical protein C1646_799883 [Rhizophagus diaphanus] [Rhizophagus sp. MUCL 43196]